MEKFLGPAAGTKKEPINSSTAIRRLQGYARLVALPPRFLPISSGLVLKMITPESVKALVVGL